MSYIQYIISGCSQHIHNTLDRADASNVNKKSPGRPVSAIAFTACPHVKRFAMHGKGNERSLRKSQHLFVFYTVNRYQSIDDKVTDKT